MKKLLLIATALTLTLTACGGGNGYVHETQAYETQPETEAQAEPEPPPPTEPETAPEEPTLYIPRPTGTVWTVADTWPGFELTTEEWIEDIIQFRSHVFAWHPKFNYEGIMYWPRNIAIGEAFDERIDWLLENVIYMSCFEVKVELQRALALLEDNHLTFGIQQPYFLWQLTSHRYPIEFLWFSDGFYLFRAIDDESITAALNHRLVAINDIAIEDILVAFKQFWSVENIYNARNSFANILNSPGVLHALGVSCGSSQPTIYTFYDANGEIVEISISAVFPHETPRQIHWQPMLWYNNAPLLLEDNRIDGDLPLFWQYPNRAHWHIFIEEYGILYIRIHSYFIHYHRDIIHDIIRAINTHGENIRATIIDARYNDGGDHAPYTENIFRRLANATPDGKLFYFMNEGSMSASLLAALDLYEQGATWIGQPQGQIIDLYAFRQTSPSPAWSSRLQNSNLLFSVPNVHHIRSNGDFITVQDLILRPHILIEYTIYDWINNHDPLLEYVLNLLR